MPWDPHTIPALFQGPRYNNDNSLLLLVLLLLLPHQLLTLTNQCIPQSWRAYGIRKSTSGWHMLSLQETVAMFRPSPLPPLSNLWHHS